MKHTLRKLLILIGILLLLLTLCWIGSAPRPSSNEEPDTENSEISYNVTVYDKSGNQYTTGLFIRTANGAWVRIQKGYDYYEQYPLTESDKEEFTHMTIGKSEIEPLYIK